MPVWIMHVRKVAVDVVGQDSLEVGGPMPVISKDCQHSWVTGMSTYEYVRTM